MRMLRWFPALLIVCTLITSLIASAQNANNQLNLTNNYFVTGDYVVGGVGLRGLGVNGLATGTINIPDANSVPAAGVLLEPISLQRSSIGRRSKNLSRHSPN